MLVEATSSSTVMIELGKSLGLTSEEMDDSTRAGGSVAVNVSAVSFVSWTLPFSFWMEEKISELALADPPSSAEIDLV